MKRVLAVAVALSAALWTVSAISQTPFDPATIEPNPLVERMADTARQGKAIVALKGFVGPSSPETVSLFADLGMTRYLDIPRAEIVGQVSGADPERDPVTLYVRGTAVVVSAIRAPASSAAAPMTTLASKLGQEAGPLARSAVCDALCHECLWLAAFGGMGVPACTACVVCGATGGVHLPDPTTLLD